MTITKCHKKWLIFYWLIVLTDFFYGPIFLGDFHQQNFVAGFLSLFISFYFNFYSEPYFHFSVRHHLESTVLKGPGKPNNYINPNIFKTNVGNIQDKKWLGLICVWIEDHIVEVANIRKLKFVKLELSLLSYLKEETILISVILALDFEKESKD